MSQDREGDEDTPCSTSCTAGGGSIPTEFLPRNQIEPTPRDEGSCLADLFQHSDSDDEAGDAAQVEQVTISGHVYHLLPPFEVGTLFAHKVWSGSKLLSSFLASPEGEKLVKNKRTVELGAGTGLPSLVSLSLGSKISVVTDYPDDDVIDSLRETVGRNWEGACNMEASRVAVVGHKWGTDVGEVMDAAFQKSALAQPKSFGNDCSATIAEDGDYFKRDVLSPASRKEPYYFDLAILSECLWMHREHANLAKSLNNLLHPTKGIAVLTYAHHIPGLEKEDDAFFAMCQGEYGFVTKHIRTESMEYMWDSEKRIDVHLKVMHRLER